MTELDLYGRDSAQAVSAGLAGCLRQRLARRRMAYAQRPR